jgi:hypothetical protein
MNAIPSAPARTQVDPTLCTRVIVIASVGIIVFMLCPWVWPLTLADTAFFWSLTVAWGFINEQRGVDKYHRYAPWENVAFWLFVVSAAACPLLWIGSAIRAVTIAGQ